VLFSRLIGLWFGTDYRIVAERLRRGGSQILGYRTGTRRISAVVWSRLLASEAFARTYREEKTDRLRQQLRAREAKDAADLAEGCRVRDEARALLAIEPTTLQWSQTGYRAKRRKEQPWLRQGPAVDE